MADSYLTNNYIRKVMKAWVFIIAESKKKKKKEKRKTKTKKNHNTYEGIEKYLKQGYFHKIYLLENFRKMNYKSPNSSFNI